MEPALQYQKSERWWRSQVRSQQYSGENQRVKARRWIPPEERAARGSDVCFSVHMKASQAEQSISDRLDAPQLFQNFLSISKYTLIGNIPIRFKVQIF